MKLVCSHCDRYDAAPLDHAPEGWKDVVAPNPRDIPQYATWTHIGRCPMCLEKYKPKPAAPAPDAFTLRG